MKKYYTSPVLISFILVALMATNPSTEEHKEAIKKEIFKAIESDNNSNIAQQLGEKIGEAFGGAIIDKMVERQNYILFSLTTIKIVKQQDDVTNNTITLGIFGQIILLKKYDKESKEFIDNIGFNGAESYDTADTAAPDYSKNFNSNDIIGIPIKIDNLEIAQHDFSDQMIWDDAKIACESLGSEWRLPTKAELNILYINKDKIRGFKGWGYWSSTEYDVYTAWLQHFTNGPQIKVTKRYELYFRAVRSF